MKIRHIFLSTLLLFTLLTSCSEDENIDPKYPTTIKELSELQLNTLLDQLEQTEFANCTSLDYFGIPILTIVDSLIDKENWKFTISKDDLWLRTKEAINEYGFFLNNTDSSSVAMKLMCDEDGLVESKFYEMYPDSLPPLWRIITKQQRYEGLEVRTTSLNFVFSPEGLFSMSGHWYSSIYIPVKDVYTEEKAMELLLNTSISYSSSKLLITDETFWHDAQKIILPMRISDEENPSKSQIELHVCWALYPETWEVLIDTQTGEILSKVNTEVI